MKPILEKIPKPLNHSIFIKQTENPVLNMPYHYHPEFELTLTEGKTGKRFIGDRVEQMEKEDLVFLGSNLPHCFIEDSGITPNSRLTVLQFSMSIFGDQFLELPETKPLKDFLAKAQSGISLTGHSKTIIKEQLLLMYQSSPLKRLIQVLELLEYLSNSQDIKMISSQSFNRQFHYSDSERLNRVYNFIAQNFKEVLTLGEAAKVANLSEAAFCRFFKQRTLKTFKEVINEMRISFATDLILKGALNEMSVEKIAKESGFNNQSNFNRQFKKITSMSPAQYAKTVDTHMPI